jgi:fructoselysine-6-P-deglycase FrlB-like protein
MMLIGEMLHAFIPTQIVAKVCELFEQDAAVLSGDCRNLAILGAAPVWAVAGSAGLKQLGAVHKIRLEPGAVGEFPVTGHP